MTGSGLIAGRSFPVPWEHKDEVRHRRLIAEGLNHTAAAAFTPKTQLAERGSDLLLTASFASAGLDVSVTPFIPARAHILAFLYFENISGVDPLNVQVRIKENGVVLTTYIVPTIALGDTGVFPVQHLRPELLANTTYVYSIEVLKGSTESGNLLTSSSMSVRVEQRSLVP